VLWTSGHSFDEAVIPGWTPGQTLAHGTLVPTQDLVVEGGCGRVGSVIGINVDIETEIVIDRPPETVSSYAADPNRPGSRR
jgi:hypothetical protein